MKVTPREKQNDRSAAATLAGRRNDCTRNSCSACAPLSSSRCATKDARRLIVRAISDWRLSERRSAELELIATELVGNALRHTDQVLGIKVSYHATTSVFRVEVADSSSTPPHPPPAAGQLAESGRGLQLVEAYADDWGHCTSADAPGKTVWAEVKLASPA